MSDTAFNPNFDPIKYSGTWYEIGKYPVFYDPGCSGAQAVYIYDLKNTIQVKNICYNSEATPTQQINGLATQTNIPGLFQLKFEPTQIPIDGTMVPFDPPVSSYRILWTNYKYSFVGDQQLDYFYILSRNPTIDDQEINFFYDMAIKLGFDPKKVVINRLIIEQTE